MTSYTTPPTFSAGNPLTAAQANILSGDIADLAAPPKARKYRSAALTATASAWTTIAFDGTTGSGFYDSHSGFSGGTYTVPTGYAGYYRMYGALLVAPTAVGQRVALALYKNGSEIARGDDTESRAAGFLGALVDDTQLLAAGDAITWRYFISAALAFQVGSALTYGGISMRRRT